LVVKKGIWAPRGGDLGQSAEAAAPTAGRIEEAVEWARDELDFAADPLQARVLRSVSRRGILNCSRQWGKSTVTAAKAMHLAWLQPESLVLVVSPSARQSGEFLKKAETFAARLGARPRGDGHNAMSLALRNGSRIVGLPGNEATVRGFSAVSLLLIDEASRVKDELYRALRPMLAVSGGALWLLSTPHGKRGFFYEEWENGGEEWERVQARGSDCPRIPAAFLEEERRKLGARMFRQEYLCEFEDSVAGMFERESIDRAFTDDVDELDV
jgi:hypothetical protein